MVKLTHTQKGVIGMAFNALGRTERANIIINRMMSSESEAAGRLAALLRDFDDQLTEAVEELTAEFIEMPTLSSILADGSDALEKWENSPEAAFADAVQVAFTKRILTQYFPALDS